MADTGTLRPVDETDSARNRRGWWVAAAAAAAVLIGGVAIGALVTSSDSSVIDQPAPTEEERSLTIAESLIAANNTGDLEAYMAHFSDNARLFDSYSLTVDYDEARDWQGFFLALGTTLDGECAIVAQNVRCDGLFADDLMRAAGVEPRGGAWTITVQDGEVTTLAYSGPNFTLVPEIALWVATNRPDFWAERFASCVSGTACLRSIGPEATFLMTPDAAEALLEILPEFLEASDKYPQG